MLSIQICFCPTLLTIFNLDDGSRFTYFTASVKFWVFKFGNYCAEQKARMNNHAAPEPEAGMCRHATSDQREQKPIAFRA